MELFHTSPEKIETIHSMGRFDEFLFFSADIYVMTAGSYVVHKLTLEEDQIIKASEIFYHPNSASLENLVAELAERLSVETNVAEALIEESTNVFDLDNIDTEDLAEISWDVQTYTARAAKILGFRAVQVTDEQGYAYMVDMLGHENDLTVI